MGRLLAADVAGMDSAQPRPWPPQATSIRFEISRGGALPLLAFGGIFAAMCRGGGAQAAVVAAAVGAVGGALSLVVHELGHVRAARRTRDVRARRIVLIWGGAATYFDGAYRSGREQARVALGGPAASLALMLVTAAAVPLAPAGSRYAVLLLALLNLLIALLTLIPVAPLDGYKLVSGLAWSLLGSEERARLVLRRLGLCLAACDGCAVVVAIAVRPALGALALAAAAGLVAQKRLVRRPPTTTP